MNQFSPNSLARLHTCHLDLQRLFQDVLLYPDCSILVGHRCQADQDLACAAGKSHAPWPIDWDDIGRFQAFALLVFARAAALGIGIRWGGDFTTIKDYDHFELLDEPINA